MATQIEILDDAVNSPVEASSPDIQENTTAQPMTQVTVLRTLSRKLLLTKRFYRDKDRSIQKQTYGNAKRFDCDQHWVSGIEDFGALLSKLEQDRSSCIIRGEPLPGIDLSKPVRKTKHKNKDGDPCFRSYENGVPWVMIDFDDTPCSPDINAEDDPEAAMQRGVNTKVSYLIQIRSHRVIITCGVVLPLIRKLAIARVI